MRNNKLKVSVILAIAVCAATSHLLYQFYSRTKSAEVCHNNLRQIGLAVLNYESLRGCFLSGANSWSWIAESIPWIEGNAPTFPDPSKTWDDPSNRQMRQFDKDTGKSFKVEEDDWGVFLCPSASARTNLAGYGLTSYVGVGGLGRDAPMLPAQNPRAGCFGYREGTRIDQIKDGLATTMAVIETARENGPWRAAGPSTIRGLDRDSQPYIGKDRQFGGLHPEGAMVLFADCSVRSVGNKVIPAVFEAMSTIAGSEKVDDDPQIILPLR